MAERQTIHDFIRKHGVTMTSERTDRNPAMEGGDRMDHWRCTLKCGGRRLTIVFSQGYGHKGAEPEVAAVLSAMASDATSALNASSWEDFARDMGYEAEVEDPRTGRYGENKKAKKIYNGCLKEHDQLVRLLGDEATEELMYQTEGY